MANSVICRAVPRDGANDSSRNGANIPLQGAGVCFWAHSVTDIEFSTAEPRGLAHPAASDPIAPWRQVGLLCLLQLVAWTVIPALVNRTPPTDTLESFLWGREWLVLSYKHPQLPSWVLQIVYHLTGSYVWSGFLASQIAVCLAFPFVYLLGRDMMGARAALAGLLLLPVTGYYSWGTRQFNHDVAQIPFWAALSWLLWRAERDNRLGQWIAFGLVAGASLYAKFTTGLILLFALAWMIAEPRARRRLATPGPWIALALSIVVAAPIFVTLVRDHFIQFAYAAVSDSWSVSHHGKFYYVGVQLALFVVFPFALWSSGLIGRRPSTLEGSSILLADARARRYLLWMGLGPAALLVLASPFVGVGEAWSKPMYSLVGLVVVAYLGRRLTR